MDVEKFNKQLKSKVALAKSYEKRNEINAAIKIWLEISEMAINFSKSRNIDVSFKNMLITRTKGIITHIKSLKSGQIDKTAFDEDLFVQEEISQENLIPEMSELNTSESHKIIAEEVNQPQRTPNNDIKIVENSEFKNIPKGFKEIQPNDFKIITPHDENYVEKHLKQVPDPELMQQRKSQNEQERFDFEDDNNNKVICFACGYDKNPKNAKICKSCGTELN